MKPGLIACCLLFSMQVFSQWNPDPKVGNIVSDIPGVKILQRSIPDGEGGMIVAFVNDWEDWNNGGVTARTFNVQRIDKTGNLKWGTASQAVRLDSFLVYMANGWLSEAEKIQLLLEPDGIGGVYIAWFISDISTALRIQHLDSSGQFTWGATPKTTNYGGFDISICRSGSGLIIGWNTASPNTANQNRMYAQRLNVDGYLLWGPTGIQVVDLPGNRYGVLVSDGNYGANAFFSDSRNAAIGMGKDIYGQRLDSNGTRLWSDTGKAICKRFGNQEISSFGIYGDFKMNKNKAFSDSAGNSIIMFSDDRNVSNNDQLYLPNWDIYGQKISPSGEILWDTSAVPITTEPGPQQPDNIVSDNNGGAVALFTSQRNYYIIQFIQRLEGINGMRVFSDSGKLVSPNPTQNSDNYSAMSVSNLGNIFVNSYSYKGGLYNQKYSALGIAQWDTSQTRIKVGAYPITTIITNPNESGIISWSENIGTNPNPYDTHIRAFKINGNGLFSTEYVAITNGSWTDPSTWSDGVVPDADSKVVINTIVTITADATCYSLQMGPGGQVIVAPGVHFTVLH